MNEFATTKHCLFRYTQELELWCGSPNSAHFYKNDVELIRRISSSQQTDYDLACAGFQFCNSRLVKLETSVVDGREVFEVNEVNKEAEMIRVESGSSPPAESSDRSSTFQILDLQDANLLAVSSAQGRLILLERKNGTSSVIGDWILGPWFSQFGYGKPGGFKLYPPRFKGCLSKNSAFALFYGPGERKEDCPVTFLTKFKFFFKLYDCRNSLCVQDRIDFGMQDSRPAQMSFNPVYHHIVAILIENQSTILVYDVVARELKAKHSFKFSSPLLASPSAPANQHRAALMTSSPSHSAALANQRGDLPQNTPIAAHTLKFTHDGENFLVCSGDDRFLVLLHGFTLQPLAIVTLQSSFFVVRGRQEVFPHNSFLPQLFPLLSARSCEIAVLHHTGFEPADYTRGCSVRVYRIPVSQAPLSHLCRRAILHLVSYDDVSRLPIPKAMMYFLQNRCYVNQESVH